MNKDKALDLALEFVEANHFGGQDAFELITAIKQARALDKKAENARELGLDYEPAQQEPVAWTPIDQPYPPGGELDILMGDGSILCEVLPQSDGDLWWGGASTGERFIDPKYASVTHWRIHTEHTTSPAAPVQEPVAWKWHQAPVKTSWGHEMVVADLTIDKDNTVSVYCERDQTAKVEAMFTPPAAPVQDSNHEFKNFHRVLCERFGYTHDEVDWKRDQISLIEWIAKQVQPAKEKAPQSANCEAPGGISSDHAYRADYKANEKQEPVKFITPLMEQQMFDDWCPYKGSPDPRIVWAAAVEAVNGLLLGATPPAAPVQEPAATAIPDEAKAFEEWCFSVGLMGASYGIMSVSSHVPTAERAWKARAMLATPSSAQRQWVGLTDDEVIKCTPTWGGGTVEDVARAIEAKLKAVNGFHSTEKNT